MSVVHYTKDHEWIRVDGEIGTVGISKHAQDQLGDIVFVELPPVGKNMSKGDEAAVVESVKAASEVYSPVSGEVIAVNDVLDGEPALINSDAEGDGWFFKIKINNPADLGDLMDPEAYASETGEG